MCRIQNLGQSVITKSLTLPIFTVQQQYSHENYHNEALTGVRAVACGLVFLHHWGLGGWSITQEFYVGVNLFFCLSGYLLFRAYSSVADFSKKFLWRYFYARLLRTWPLFIFLLFLGYGLGGNLDWPHLLFWDSNVAQQMPQMWSVRVEWCFYLLLPLCFWLLKEFGIGAVWGFHLLLGFLGWLLFCYDKSLNGSIIFWIYSYWGRWPDFLIGFSAAYFLTKIHLKNTLLWTLLLIFGCLGLLYFLNIQRLNPSGYGAYTPVGFAAYAVLTPLLSALLFLLLEKPNHLLKRVFENALIVFLGKISYVIFLLHYGYNASLLYAVNKGNIFIFTFLVLVISSVLYFAERLLRHAQFKG